MCLRNRIIDWPDAIAAETPSTRVRPQTMVIGRSAYVVGQIIINQLMPRMINSGPGSWVSWHSNISTSQCFTDIKRTGEHLPVSSGWASIFSFTYTCGFFCQRRVTERLRRLSISSRPKFHLESLRDMRLEVSSRAGFHHHHRCSELTIPAYELAHAEREEAEVAREALRRAHAQEAGV